MLHPTVVNGLAEEPIGHNCHACRHCGSSMHPLTLLFPSPCQLRARKAKRAQQYKQLLAKRAREEAKLQARVRKEKKEFYQLLGKEQQRHQQAMAAS